MALNNHVAANEAGAEKFSGPRQHLSTTDVAVHENARPSQHLEHIAAIHEHLSQSSHNSCRIQAYGQQLDMQKEAHMRTSYQNELESEQQERSKISQRYIDLYHQYESVCRLEAMGKQELDRIERLSTMQKEVIQQQDELLASYKSHDPTLFEPAAMSGMGQYQSPNEFEFVYSRAASYNSANDTLSESLTDLTEDAKTDNEPGPVEIAEDILQQTPGPAMKECWLSVNGLPDGEMSGMEFSPGPPYVPLSPQKAQISSTAVPALVSDPLTRPITRSSRVESSLTEMEGKRSGDGESQQARKRPNRRLWDCEIDAFPIQTD